MANAKHFMVIGLGTFGAAVARRLTKNGCRATGIDRLKSVVESLKDELYEGVICDATDRDALAQLDVKRADGVFVALGEDISQSLLATLHVKELGGKRIMVKGVTQEHGRLLKFLGVERVIFPEEEMAVTLADRVTWPNIVDFLPIGPEYTFMELAAPDSFIGKTLLDLNLRRELGVWVVGVKNALTGALSMFPDGDYQVGADQMILVVGKQEGLAKLQSKE